MDLWLFEPVTYILTETPWVRLTYLFPDDEVDRLGLGKVVLSCVICGSAWTVEYTTPLPRGEAEQAYGTHGDLVARSIRDQFQNRHRHADSSLTDRRMNE